MKQNRFRGDEAGLTLVEVIVVISVSALFLGLLAVMFSNGLTAQQRATARDQATGKALVVTASLQSSVRNATEIAVAGGGTRVDAAVITPTGDFECRAWALDAGGALRYSAASDARGGDISGWTVIAEGVRGTLSAGAAFAADGARGLVIGMSLTIGDTTVPVRDGVAAQAVANREGAPPCW
jgi:type II secretory pathway pseudopilin PulG